MNVFAFRMKTYGWIVVLLPLIHLIAVLSVDDTSQGFHLGNVRALAVACFIAYFITKRIEINAPNIYIITYSMYVLFLSVISEYPMDALSSSVRLIIGIMAFPMGYAVVRHINAFRTFSAILAIVGAVIVIYIIFSNITGFGTSNYLEDSFYTGRAKVNIAKTTAALIVLSPALALVSSKRWMRLAVAILMASWTVVVLLAMKRGPLLGIAVSLLVYLLLTPRPGRTLKLWGIVSICVLSLLPVWSDTLQSRLEVRDLGGRDIETVSRQQEAVAVLALMRERSATDFIFGRNQFINRGTAIRDGRVLHMDYMVFLHGGGVIGLLLFMLVYVVIFREMWRYYKIVRRQSPAKELFAVFVSLLVLQMFISISGSWSDMLFRTVLFLSLGALCGLVRTEARRTMSLKNN